ncbi:hypothetical protein Q9R32_16365 [Actinotalea sp. AC32]|nr:hypothetical protein [Actinotalea sp. AC32]
MHVEVLEERDLRFADGVPVRAASAVARLGDGWLVAQDDATFAAWVLPHAVERVRVLPPVHGLDTFEESLGTKRLKPDLEAALGCRVDGRDGVLLLGSGSSDARTRGAVVDASGRAVVAELAALYDRVADVLRVDRELLNLEGACRVGDVVRWFHRGVPGAGDPTRSVDVDARGLAAVVLGRADPAEVGLGSPRHYDLGEVDGVGLAVTDAVRVGDQVVASVAAEDTDDPRHDGPVVGAALVVLEDDRVVARAPLPHVRGHVPKVEGLATVAVTGASVTLLATVDDDDPDAASAALVLRLVR